MTSEKSPAVRRGGCGEWSDSSAGQHQGKLLKPFGEFGPGDGERRKKTHAVLGRQDDETGLERLCFPTLG